MIFAALVLLSAPSVEQRAAACGDVQPIRVTLSQLNERPEDYVGRCVSASGRWLGGALVGGGETQMDGLPRERLGVYDDPPYAFLKAAPDRKMWEVTGVVSTCKILREEVQREQARAFPVVRTNPDAPPPPPLPVMLAGFCHYNGGPFVWLASSRPIAAPEE